MKPVHFKEVNVEFAKDQQEYQTLPAFRDGKGEVITCWKLSFRERLRVLFKGVVWLSLLSFNGPLTPSYLTTQKKELLVTKEE